MAQVRRYDRFVGRIEGEELHPPLINVIVPAGRVQEMSLRGLRLGPSARCQARCRRRRMEAERASPAMLCWAELGSRTWPALVAPTPISALTGPSVLGSSCRESRRVSEKVPTRTGSVNPPDRVLDSRSMEGKLHLGTNHRRIRPCGGNDPR